MPFTHGLPGSTLAPYEEVCPVGEVKFTIRSWNDNQANTATATTAE